jgi:hypothetical protein
MMSSGHMSYYIVGANVHCRRGVCSFVDFIRPKAVDCYHKYKMTRLFFSFLLSSFFPSSHILHSSFYQPPKSFYLHCYLLHLNLTMAGSAEFGGPPRQLRPDQVPLLLNTIDKLRSIGVGEHVELPQMIICGSKANAKRSVIESISRIRFPVRKDFHNGFVTEITLRRHATTRFQVSVEPGPSSSKSQLDIQELKGSMVTAPNAEQSVSLIEKATGSSNPLSKTDSVKMS